MDPDAPPSSGSRALAALGLGCLALWLAVALAAPGPLESIKDEPIHWLNAVRGAWAQPRPDLWTLDPAYPPLHGLLTAGPARSAYAVGVLPPRLLLAAPGLLLLAALGFGALRLGGPRVGLGAGAILAVALLPWSWSVTPELTAVATPALFALACRRAAARPDLRAAVLLAGATALCLLAKQTTPLFCVVPAAWLARRVGTRRGLGFAVAAATGAVAAWLLFYARLPIDPLQDVLRRATTGESTVDPRRALQQWSFYGGSLLRFAGPALLLPLLARAWKGEARWLLAGVLVPAAVLTALPIKQDSYLLPVLPALAAWCASPLAQPRWRRLGGGLIAFAAGGSLLFGVVPDALQLARVAPLEAQDFRGAAGQLAAWSPGDAVPSLAGPRGLASRLLHLRGIEAGLRPRSTGNALVGGGVTEGHVDPQASRVVLFRAPGADASRCWTEAEHATWTGRSDLGPPPRPAEDALARRAMASGRVVGSHGVGRAPGWRVPAGVTLCELPDSPTPSPAAAPAPARR